MFILLLLKHQPWRHPAAKWLKVKSLHCNPGSSLWLLKGELHPASAIVFGGFTHIDFCPCVDPQADRQPQANWIVGFTQALLWDGEGNAEEAPVNMGRT